MERRESRLSEADPAIVGGDVVVCPDRPTWQSDFKLFEQQFILKNAAGENGDIDVIHLADCIDGLREASRQAAMECPCNFGHRPFIHAVVDRATEQGPEIQLASCERE
jgi:hypothetical protein